MVFCSIEVCYCYRSRKLYTFVNQLLDCQSHIKTIFIIIKSNFIFLFPFLTVKNISYTCQYLYITFIIIISWRTGNLNRKRNGNAYDPGLLYPEIIYLITMLMLFTIKLYSFSIRFMYNAYFIKKPILLYVYQYYLL